MKKYILNLFIFLSGVVFAIVFNQKYMIKNFDVKYIPTFSFADGSVYSGELNDKQLLEGKGYIEWPSGAIYKGVFDNGLMHGQGEYKDNSGYKYKGEFKYGMPEGNGTIVYANGVRYEGQVKNFLANGVGEMKYVDGQVYTGEFKDDLASGKGKWMSPDKYIYIGEFKDNWFEGKGEITYQNGNQYLGDFKKGNKHGLGRYITAEKDVYRGEYLNDEMTGKGIIFFVDGAKKSGEFKSWELHGKGVAIDKNGNKYAGEFEYGYLKKGKYLAKSGETYVGGFDYGSYSGKGKLIDKNGNVFKGAFEYGQKNGEGKLVYKEPLDDVDSITGRWSYNELVEAEEFKVFPKGEITEFAIYNQQQMLDQTLNNLVIADKNKIEIFTLGVAPFGAQEVFRREINYVEDYFNENYQNGQHSIYLSNSRRVLNERPLATLTSLERSINKIADTMNKNQDVLFLYITSHGSKDKTISFNQPGLTLTELSSEKLSELLDNSGIKWKVVVLSACYSGGFIDDLKNKHTLILTASAADKTSFGCDDDNQFTYFGEAFFKDALPDSKSLLEAFNKTKTAIKEREDFEELENSVPQIHKSKEIINYLNQIGL